MIELNVKSDTPLQLSGEGSAKRVHSPRIAAGFVDGDYLYFFGGNEKDLGDLKGLIARFAKDRGLSYSPMARASLCG